MLLSSEHTNILCRGGFPPFRQKSTIRHPFLALVLQNSSRFAEMPSSPIPGRPIKSTRSVGTCRSKENGKYEPEAHARAALNSCCAKPKKLSVQRKCKAIKRLLNKNIELSNPARVAVFASLCTSKSPPFHPICQPGISAWPAL